MLHADQHLTERIRLAGQGTLPLWRWLASWGMGIFVVVAVILVTSGTMPWFQALMPVVATHVITMIVQQIVRRERPPIEKAKIVMWKRTPSFPSAHSSGSMAFALSIAGVTVSLGNAGLITAVSMIVLAVFIGVSRIVVGVHYLSDVVCGFIFGLLVTGVLFAVA
jgi:undecaprenyl-diphosphatase